MMLYFMVVDQDKHREDEYEICVSLAAAMEAGQKRLDEAKGYYDDREVEVRQLGGKEGWWWIAEAQCGSFTISICTVEVPVSNI